jgi:hypothetical protein
MKMIPLSPASLRFVSAQPNKLWISTAEKRQLTSTIGRNSKCQILQMAVVPYVPLLCTATVSRSELCDAPQKQDLQSRKRSNETHDGLLNESFLPPIP